MKKIIFVMLWLIVCGTAQAAENLVLVTIDGLRWQDVFRGADGQFIANKKFNHDVIATTQQFGGKTIGERRHKLMPFITTTVASKGILLGNRDQNSNMEVTNPWWFSYPGYNEMLTGAPDPAIDSNDNIPNPNVNFMEWLNHQQGYQGRIAAFGSWDAFTGILNRQRSGLMVNAGFEPLADSQYGPQVTAINHLQTMLTSPWPEERYDAYTFSLAMAYLKQHQPKVLYIALGDTDELAHAGQYDQYLRAAHQADQMLQELWQQLQSMPQYAGKTNLLITVDHGRGRTANDWMHHASAQAVKIYPEGEKRYPKGIEGSNEIWLAALGPDVMLGGETHDNHATQNQLAATALALLGQSYQAFSDKAAPPITMLLNPH